MKTGVRAMLVATVLAAALPVILAADASQVSHYVDVQLQLAELLYSTGRYADALDAFSKADLRGDGPLRIRAKAGLVRTALRIAEFDLAQEHAALLARLAPDDTAVKALRADALWAGGRFDEAEALYRDVLAVDPAEARGHYGMARALAARNRLDEAFDEARTAVRLAPDDPEVHFTLGSFYTRTRQYEEAIAAYGNYVNLLPAKDASPMATWARAEIRFLRSFGDRVPELMSPDVAARRHTVPFTLVGGKVIVRARVNRREWVDFTLDTGAEHTVLSVPTGQRLGIYPIVTTLSAGVGQVGLRGLQVGRIDTFEMGTFRVDNIRCLIKNPPLGELTGGENESFSPLALGLSMQVDYRRRELVLGRTLPEQETAIELPLRMNRLATIRGVVNGQRTTSFVIDTGGEVVSISSATARTLLQPPGPARIKLKVYGTSGWDPEAYLLPGVQLAFDGQLRLPGPVVVLNLRAPSALLGYQIGGILGHNFLSKYRVGIDLERSVLRLDKM